MSHVLIFDSDPEHADELALTRRRNGRSERVILRPEPFAIPFLNTVRAVDALRERALREQICEKVSSVARRSFSPSDYRMAILDPAAEDVVPLLDGLKDIDIAAIAFQTKQDFLRLLEKQPINLAVMIIHSRSWWEDELRSFCQSIRYLQEKPEPDILCILIWAPENTEEETRDRIIGDALRADVLHER